MKQKSKRTSRELKQSEQLRTERKAALLADINAAKSDMEVAQKNFDCVFKSDDVDVCIYRLRAAEARYGALLKRLKELTS